MLRRLVMMRHAKSSWSSGASTDHARPLNKRGRRSAAAMGAHLRAGPWCPTRVVLSDSTRTQETLRLMDLDPRVEVELAPALYHGGPKEVREALVRQTTTGPVLMLGHEPGWSEAVTWLSGVPVHLKTADAVLLEAREPGEWPALVAAPGALRWVDHIFGREVLKAALSEPGRPS